MPFKRCYTGATTFGLIALMAFQFPVCAQATVDESTSNADKKITTKDRIDKKQLLIAQAGAATASEIADVAAAASISGKKQKNELLITDSLWGNLILDLAYQRDKKLRQLSKRLNLVNLGTAAAVTGIAGGTLAQSIIALGVLNPPPGQSDSYLPGGLGIGFAGLTLVTFASRTMINHVLVTKLRKRQLEIKHKVESILARFESSRGDNGDAQKELVALIGERATNEWVQLWRSSNTLAELKQPRISIEPTDLLAGHHM